MTNILWQCSISIQSTFRRVLHRLGTTNISWDLQIDDSRKIFHLSDTMKEIIVDTYSVHFDRLIIDQYWSQWWWWILQIFHIHNFFIMILYQLLRIVEYTSNSFEFCVLEHFRIRQEIRFKKDDWFHRQKKSHFNTLILYASNENVAFIAYISNFFSKIWKILSMCRCFVYFMFLNFGGYATSSLRVWKVLFTLYLDLVLLCQFPDVLKILLLSTLFRNFDFRFRISVLPVSWSLVNSFSFIVIYPIDSRVQIWWGSFFLVLTAFLQNQRSYFNTDESSFEKISCPRFDMTPIVMRSLILDRKLFTSLQEYIQKLKKLSKRKKGHHSSLETLALVQMSAKCFLLSLYLIWR